MSMAGVATDQYLWMRNPETCRRRVVDTDTDIGLTCSECWLLVFEW